MIEQQEVYGAAAMLGLTMLSALFWFILRYAK